MVQALQALHVEEKPTVRDDDFAEIERRGLLRLLGLRFYVDRTPTRATEDDRGAWRTVRPALSRSDRGPARTKQKAPRSGERGAFACRVSPVGIEPTTRGLRVHCSTN
jgi:hypothetical protein